MENRPFPIPTGEAFLVKTPYLDKIADRLYKEQQQQQLTQQNEAKLLDTEFSKNVSKLRDADIPEYTKKYQDYKNAKINLLKGKFKTNDDFIKAQLDAQRAMADWGSLGAKSIQEKETEEQYAKAVMNDKTGRYDQNAPKILIERRKTPLSKFKQEVAIPGTNTVVPIDLNDIDGLVKYKGQNIDFTKTFKDAQGTRQVYGGEVTTPSKDGFTTTKTVYKAFNPPSKQFDVLVNSRKGSDWEKSFLFNHDYTDAEANEIVTGYERLKQTPEFQAAYKDIPDIPQTAFASNLGRAMALSVMKNAQLNPPIAETKKSQQDIGAVMDRRFKEQKELIGLRGAEARRNQRNQDELIRGRKDVDFNTIGNLSDNVFTQVGKTMIPDRGAYKGQEIRMIFQEDVDPNRWNLLRGYDEGKRQMGIQPDEVRVPDGKGGFTKHKVLYQDPATRDIKGANMRTRSKEAIQDEYVNYVSSTKAKSEMNSKASENTNNQTGQGKGTQKQKINGW